MKSTLQPTLTLLITSALLALGSQPSAAGFGEWTSQGPYGGYIYTLAVDQADPDVLFAGTQGGGVFKSTDGGASWSPVNDGLRDLYVRALAIDPETPSTVYAGTQRGLHKSVDGGLSWFPADIGIGPNSQWSTSLAIDPKEPSTVYAGTLDDLFKSVDGGGSWSVSLDVPQIDSVRSVVIDPRTTSTVYALASRSGVFKSVDGGASWAAVSAGLPDDRFQQLVVDPENPLDLYLATLNNGTHKSTDGALTWTPLGDGLPSLVWTMAVVAGSPSTAYAGTIDGLYEIAGDETTWRPAGGELRRRQVQTLAAAASHLFAGTDGAGVFRSDDGGSSWKAINHGLDTLLVWALEFHPEDPNVLYAATSGGVFRSDDGAKSWEFLTTGVQDAAFYDIAIDPQNPSILYAGALWVYAFNDRFWVLAAATTDVEYTLRVTDSVTGLVNTYFNPLAQSADAIIDSNAFATCATPAAPVAATPSRRNWLRASSAAPTVRETATVPSACVPSPTRLCLQRERFSIEVEWRDYSSNTGPGRIVPFSSGDSGLLWFFSESNWEVLVKVLDGCGINDHFWVFAAATTNVEVTLRVTDTVTGVVRSYLNPLGQAAAAVTDAFAFATCDR